MTVAGRTVAIRCDATPEVGLGHLIRCLALTEGLREQGLRVELVGDVVGVPLGTRRVRELAVPVHAAPESAEDLVRMLDSVDAVALVTDSYRLDPTVHQKVRESGRHVVAIVDAAAPSLPADLLINQNVDAATTMQGAHLGRVLAGPGYALLRGAVTERRPPDAPVGARAERVLVVIGGTDPHRAAPLLAQCVLRTGCPVHLDVICADADLAAQVEQLPRMAGQRVLVHAPVDDLAALAAQAQLVVTAAGTTVLELACLGLAMALVTVADNQRAGARALQAHGAAALLGDRTAVQSDAGGTSRALAELLADVDQRTRLASAAYGLVDGRGRSRVAAQIRGLLDG